ncbi:MAG: hypothetical protein KC931_22640, partial [Candidatus Omnitrophica bacterium]|nr:hypothetical protein [Candidatus Omnitrophota bacterium]
MSDDSWVPEESVDWESPPSRREERPSRLFYITLVVYLISILAFLAFGLTPQSWDESTPYDYETYSASNRISTVVILNPRIAETSFLLSVTCFLVLLCLGAIGLARMRHGAAIGAAGCLAAYGHCLVVGFVGGLIGLKLYGILAAILFFAAAPICVYAVFRLGRKPEVVSVAAWALAVIGFPLAFLGALVYAVGPWTIEAESKGPNGEAYYFLDTSFLQGQTMALAKSDRISWWKQEFEVLGCNNGDSPRSWASVIRPAGAPAEDYGQLYWSPEDVLVGIRYDQKCFLAYDLPRDRFIGHDDVEELSPFILLGPDTVPHEPDVQAIREEIARVPEGGYLYPPGRPHIDSVTPELNHPNPIVRELAAEFLR